MIKFRNINTFINKRFYLKTVKKFLPESFLLAYKSSNTYKYKLIKSWLSPDNSHLIKEKRIIDLQNIFKCDIFIETGTYQGEMVYKLNSYFKKLYTVELDNSLFKAAKKRFRGFYNIVF